MSVLAQRDGWTLSAWRWPRSGSLLRHVYQLDGLTVTDAQLQAMTARSSHMWWVSPECLIMHGVSLTWEQARAIQDGANPVTVLTPRFRARSLTLRER